MVAPFDLAMSRPGGLGPADTDVTVDTGQGGLDRAPTPGLVQVARLHHMVPNGRCCPSTATRPVGSTVAALSGECLGSAGGGTELGLGGPVPDTPLATPLPSVREIVQPVAGGQNLSSKEPIQL
jgi:hypothetical protein